MTPRFIRRFRVRHYELDAFGHVSGVNLVRYMQEAAIEASSDLGFSPDWYRQHGVGWVVRRLSVRYHAPVVYGDEIAAATWLSGLRGVRSIREYDLTRSSDGRRVARGRAEWVYMDSQTGQPTRIPDSWADAFTMKDKPEDLGVRLDDPRPIESAHRYSSRCRVPFHELDTVQHVNHAVYLQWIAQAHLDAAAPPATRRSGPCKTAGWRSRPAMRFNTPPPRSTMKTSRSSSWLCETAENGAAWTHEIHNADTRKLLARDYARIAFVNPRYEPITPPAQIIEDIARRSSL